MDLHLCQLWVFLGGLTVSAALLAHPCEMPEASADRQSPAASWQNWLDEVRAQRQAWEARRKAAQQERRRQIDPQWAAQHKARVQKNQRRRQALRDEINRHRETFWNSIPWSGPYERTWQDGAPARPSSDPPSDPTQNPLPGWNNLWYYRGY